MEKLGNTIVNIVKQTLTNTKAMSSQLPKQIRVKGNSQANYTLFIDKDGKFKMTYPVIKRGKLMFGQTKTKSINQELYQKAYEYTQQGTE